MAVKYPEIDEEQRKRIIDRNIEEKRPLNEAETLRISEYLKVLGKTVSLEKLLKDLGFGPIRSSQVFVYLKNLGSIHLDYRKGEWFLSVNR